MALGNSPECPTAANRAIVTDDRAIRRAVAGDVLLLRGHLGVVGLAHGAVHRSPPIEGSGQLRVVLVLSA